MDTIPSSGLEDQESLSLKPTKLKLQERRKKRKKQNRYIDSSSSFSFSFGSSDNCRLMRTEALLSASIPRLLLFISWTSSRGTDPSSCADNSTIDNGIKVESRKEGKNNRERTLETHMAFSISHIHPFFLF